MQVGLGSPALTLIVPVGGFEVKMKHVSLQPVSEIPNKGHPSINFQAYPRRARLLLTSGNAIRHLRRSGSSRGNSYSTSGCPASSMVRPTYLCAALVSLLAQPRRSGFRCPVTRLIGSWRAVGKTASLSPQISDKVRKRFLSIDRFRREAPCRFRYVHDSMARIFRRN